MTIILLYRDNSNTKKYLHIGAYLAWTLTALFFLIILCLYNNIKIATAVLKTSATFISDNMHTLLIPIFSMIFTISFGLVWMTISIFLFSAGEIQGTTGGTQYKHLVW